MASTRNRQPGNRPHFRIRRTGPHNQRTNGHAASDLYNAYIMDADVSIDLRYELRTRPRVIRMLRRKTSTDPKFPITYAVRETLIEEVSETGPVLQALADKHAVSDALPVLDSAFPSVSHVTTKEVPKTNSTGLDPMTSSGSWLTDAALEATEGESAEAVLEDNDNNEPGSDILMDAEKRLADFVAMMRPALVAGPVQERTEGSEATLVEPDAVFEPRRSEDPLLASLEESLGAEQVFGGTTLVDLDIWFGTPAVHSDSQTSRQNLAATIVRGTEGMRRYIWHRDLAATIRQGTEGIWRARRRERIEAVRAKFRAWID